MAKRGNASTKKSAKARSKLPVESESEEDYTSDGDDAASLHSDALDEWSDGGVDKADSQKKRQRGAQSSTRTPSSKSKPASGTRSTPKSKRGASEKTPARKKRKVEDVTDECDSDDIALKDGQQVVGKVVEAPTTGWAPEGQISQHTLDFLTHMRDPTCNDRVWFKYHEPIYRRCEKEFKQFIEAFTAMLTDVDPQIPPLPAKDVTHRIYRDVRFSNDKTPYKTELSASFSRSGRKGQFAFCKLLREASNGLSDAHLKIMFKPGDGSLLAAGAWCPAKNELNMLRNHIKHSSDRLREVLSEPEFVAHFGEPYPHPQGLRRSVFGAEGELKTAPKGVDKNHKDIDLLKCRSLAVSQKFTDKQVLAGTFMQELENIARILRPFVHCLNDMMTLPVESESESDHVLD